MWIAPTAFTAFCNDIGFITRNIGKDSSTVLLFYNSSDRNTDNKVFGIFTTASAASAVFALFCGIFSFITEIGKC